MSASAPAWPQAEAEKSQELVHYGDLIEVDVLGSLEYDWRGTINPEGFLDGVDALENRVYALCRSNAQIAADLEQGFSKILRDPRVAVRVLDRSNRAVAFLHGAVRTPQRLRIKRKILLNELLVLAGGISDTASGEVTIFRPVNASCGPATADAEQEFVKASTGEAARTVSIKISDLLRGVPDANPEIRSGDIVTVVEALPIYVIGGVAAPRQISARGEMTLA
ncbi:MAG: polysaccharide biosynthesis/export family protein, partial [Acidobacteria bacterium]|nr:polysaccharide biosynthesis/export family protein [Acidobacteriota bacterium]MCA1609180.1 polysaccharide biosynthesis/export family protein [Acidobacteriota bacterium]